MVKKKVDPRVRRTHNLLRDSLIELMDEKSYESITIQDITERATVNRATFYRHYEDKEDLLNQSIDKMLRELFGDASKFYSVTKDPHELQHYVALHIFEHIARSNKFFHVMLIKKGIPNFIQYLKDFIFQFYDHMILETNVKEEELPVTKEMIVSYISAAYIGVISWWLENDMPCSPSSMAKQMIQINLQGPIQLLEQYLDR
ncbi:MULTISPECIES: TetR/AcrR family transcriptional regulator [Bacillus]|uniref:TetR/AcrR family transcriptional regulator n=1 Tax=Bacillus TaxID=1386 RepID=UPI0022243525|nr:TetR/AcrR family transcriptional regulator [Bacillus thuringiensis]UYX56020.1 TetR/AcrR family transcriptional regulator [Bacillus thuringiensis]